MLSIEIKSEFEVDFIKKNISFIIFYIIIMFNIKKLIE